MYRNYESRVKDFVLDMTNPHSMVEHKDVTEKVTNTRLELMNEQFAKNPEKRKPLVFRGYTSEADGIKDTIKNHKYLYYLPDYEKIKKERKKLKMYSPQHGNIKLSKNIKTSSLDKSDIGEEVQESFKISRNITYISCIRDACIIYYIINKYYF